LIEHSCSVPADKFMARRIFEGVAARLAAGELGASARGIQSMRVVLHESHLAWAAYESELSA
jgi:6-pyruvoyltetrahydropterin/6-carboxytetrahydropterin synthase